jgi:alpha-beta hydrolase superfamily lysophospholipase
MRKLRFVGVALVGIAGAVGLAWMVGAKLVTPVNHKVVRPQDFSADFVAIPSANHEIAGWWTDTHQGLPVILLLHAVRADRTMMISRARLFQRHGFSTLLIDLQAHGETPGTAITFGKRESDDVVAAIAWIKNRAPNRKVGIVGCSMGGAATLLAPQPLGVDAVVLESVYPRIGLAVENRVRLRLGPLAPLVTPMLFWQLRSRLHLEPEELEPIRSIGQLGAPVLIAAGSDNQHTTLSETKALYVAAREPKELWILTGAKHQDLLHFDTSGYEAHVLRFLTQHLGETLPEPQKLNKAEVERLVEEHTAENKPLVFASYQGARRCCDLGDTNLQFVPQNHVIEFGDGFVPWRAGLSYEIAEDGTIRLGVSDDRETAGMNEKVGLNAVKIYRYGDAFYLVRAAEVDPDLSFDPGTLWPFKATTELIRYE